MAEAQNDNRPAGHREWFCGPYSLFGLAIAAIVLAADQVSKAYMLHVYDIASKGVVRITPFFDLVLVWNAGISYGLFPQHSDIGRWGLILFAFAAALALILWLARVTTPLAAAAIGLILGGAIGNAIDRMVYGAVADFFSFHALDLRWYVFNIADAAIVAGVVGLLYEALFGGHKKVSNPSKM
jgi:signal peptidase II